MTDRPTRTKPRSQSADGSPCIARSPRSADGTAPEQVESELIAKARVVLAGLDLNRRAVVLSASWHPFIPNFGLGDRIVRSLQRRGLLRKVRLASYTVTDLGREVARLLSEVQS